MNNNKLTNKRAKMKVINVIVFNTNKTSKVIKRDVKVLLRGGELDINWDKKTNNIYMKGMATKVYDGIMEI